MRIQGRQRRIHCLNRLLAHRHHVWYHLPHQELVGAFLAEGVVHLLQFACRRQVVLRYRSMPETLQCHIRDNQITRRARTGKQAEHFLSACISFDHNTATTAVQSTNCEINYFCTTFFRSKLEEYSLRINFHNASRRERMTPKNARCLNEGGNTSDFLALTATIKPKATSLRWLRCSSARREGEL